MNSQEFKQKLQQLEDATWQQLLDGKALCLEDDEKLVLADASDRNLIVPTQESAGLNVPTLRLWIMERVDELVEEYYLRNPLSLTAFNRKVLALIGQYGATKFVGKYGQLPELSLFEEKGEVIVENLDSPRQRYGIFCGVEEETIPDTDVEKIVRHWVESGEAYESYISMNVCRYSC